MHNLLENIRDHRLYATTAGKTPLVASQRPSPVSRFSSVARQLKMKKSVMSCLMTGTGGLTRPAGGRLSVLSPENRQFLDTQGQKSPEPPRRKIILGGKAFSLAKNGELYPIGGDEVKGSEDEEGKDDEDSADNPAPVSQETESSNGGTPLDSALAKSRQRSLSSVGSIASSITSIDTTDEEIQEDKRQLSLSLMKKSSGVQVTKLLYPNFRRKRRVNYNRVNVSMYVCSPQHLNIMALFLGLHASYLYQDVSYYTRNIIVSKRFFKMF